MTSILLQKGRSVVFIATCSLLMLSALFMEAAVAQSLSRPSVPLNPRSAAECHELYSRYEISLAELLRRAKAAAAEGEAIYARHSPCMFGCIQSAQPHFSQARKLRDQHSDLLSEAVRARELCMSRIKAPERAARGALRNGILDSDKALKETLGKLDKINTDVETAESLWNLANATGNWRQKYGDIEQVVRESNSKIPGNAIAKAMFEENLRLISKVHRSAIESLQYALSMLPTSENYDALTVTMNRANGIDDPYASYREQGEQHQEGLFERVLSEQNRLVGDGAESVASATSSILSQNDSENARLDRIASMQQAIYDREQADIRRRSRVARPTVPESRNGSSGRAAPQTQPRASCSEVDAWSRNELNRMEQMANNSRNRSDDCRWARAALQYYDTCTAKYRQCGATSSNSHYANCTDPNQRATFEGYERHYCGY